MPAIDITQLNAQLGAYARRHSQDIATALFQGLEFEGFMTSVPGVTDEYTTQSADISEVLQPFQCDWTPKGTASFDARINKVRQIKIDCEIPCIDDLSRSWLAFLTDEEKDRREWPIVRWIIDRLVLPKAIAELDDMSYNGVYSAPTPGTPGAAADSADGMAEIIANEISGGGLTPIPTGAITPANIVDAVEDFVGAIPKPYRNLEGPIFMSCTNARNYELGYRNAYGQNNNYNGNGQLRIDGSRKFIIPIAAMEGSDRFICTPRGNMFKMYDKINTISNLNAQLEKRQIILFGDFKRGWGIGDRNRMFVNDQT